MSELLDRVRREIRERLESTRAAVFEYERLEAALHALGDGASRATHGVRGGNRGSRTLEAARRSGAAAKPSTRTRTSKQPSAASSSAKRAARARAGAASASPRRSAGAAGDRERSRRGAGGRAPSARAKKGTSARADAATPARRRAPRGANREALLRVIGERPGVTARELAAASGVTDGTLYALLRRLINDGTLEKRELPGGQAGYTLRSAGATAQPAAAQPQAATSEAGPRAAPRPERDRAGAMQSARSAPTGKQPG